MPSPEEKIYEGNTKKMEKPFLAARIPLSLNQAIESHVESTGESKTETIINALAAYLGWSEDKTTKNSASDRISSLEKRIEELEAAVYKPRQISFLDAMALRKEENSLVIKVDKDIDNKIKDEYEEECLAVINNDKEVDNGSKEEDLAVIGIDKESDNNDFDSGEWLTTREAYERYGQALTYKSFRNLKPQQFLEKFGLESNPLKRKSGSHTSRWLKPTR